MKAKYRIDNIEIFRKKLNTISKKIGEGMVVDFYFKNENIKQGELRLRKNDDGKIVTLKIPLHSEKFQKNEEYNFIVDDAEDFVKLLEWGGFKPDCILHKKFEEYFYNDSIVRLVEIDKKLIYVEIIIESFNELSEDIEKNIIDTAKKLNLKDSDLDSRYYCSL